jgi:hypothetical protein
MAAPVLTIGGVVQTSKVKYSTLTVKFNTLDVTLEDPATVPANGNAVTLTNPTWAGTVKSVTTADPVDKTGHVRVTVAATNTDVASASAGPWNLSDAPSNPPYGYRNLQVTTTVNSDASTSHHGSCVIEQPGLWPAMTFTLTSANQGYSGASFSVRNTTVTWPAGSARTAEYLIEFGDPIVTMEVWMNDAVANMPDGSIAGTKITNGGIDTPQLAANSVTTAILDAGAVTADKVMTNGLSVGNMAGSTRNLVPDGGFEIAMATGRQWWQFNGAAYRDGYSSVGSAYAHSGSNMAAPSYAGTGYLTSSQFPVTGGRRYYVAGWARGWNGNSTNFIINLCVRWLDKDGATVGSDVDCGQTYYGQTNPYRQWRGFGLAPASATHAFVFWGHFAAADATGLAMYDEVEFYECDEDVSHAGGAVEINSAGVKIINGALTVASDGGSTVIIDGTSDIFKISASGTGTIAIPALSGANYGSTTTWYSVPALGSPAVCPGNQVFLSTASDATQWKESAVLNAWAGAGNATWAASSSGGGTTGAYLAPIVSAFATTYLSAGTVYVGLTGYQTTGSIYNVYLKWYTLVEAAM